jgi:hypothetical protein
MIKITIIALGVGTGGFVSDIYHTNDQLLIGGRLKTIIDHTRCAQMLFAQRMRNCSSFTRKDLKFTR